MRMNTPKVLSQICSKKLWLNAAVVAMSSIAVGCAITDYVGWAQHKTGGDAALWASDVAFQTGNPTLDGTYNYTVAYDCRGFTNTGPICGVPSFVFFQPGPAQPTIIITSLRNPVIGAFGWTGVVDDRPGSNIQGRAGSTTFPPFTPAGKYMPAWVSADNQGGCQFYGLPFTPPLKQNFLGVPWGLATCFLFPQEEVDANQDLQQNFASLSDLMSQLWSGAIGSTFTVQLTQLTLNGTTVALTNPATISVIANNLHPGAMSIDLTTPGGQDLLRALLNHTVDGQAVTVSGTFAGGMSLAMPANLSVAVNHSVLSQMVH